MIFAFETETEAQFIETNNIITYTQLQENLSLQVLVFPTCALSFVRRALPNYFCIMSSHIFGFDAVTEFS